MRKFYVSDITLKEVENQAISLTFREKLSIAEKLDNLNLDAIELPSISSSKESEIIYRTICESLKCAMVKIPIGDTDDSFELAVKCIKKAKKACLQVELPISTALMEYSYHLKSPMMIEKIEKMIAKATASCENVEFVALDAFRAEGGFVELCAKSAYANGAKSITVVDSEGTALPSDYKDIVCKIKGACDIDVYVQPSNKLLMAPACAIEAIKAGASGVKTSTCGDDLMLSNFSEIYRAKKFNLDIESKIDVTNINSVCDNIFDMAKSQEEVQIVVDKDFVESSASIKDVADVIKKLGYELSDSDIGKVYEEFKRLTAKKETIDIKELEAIVASSSMQVPSTYHLINYVVNSGNIIPATANVTLEKDGQKLTGVSTGDGPIDAAFHAIEQIVGHHYELDDFQVHAVTKGREAVGSSIIRLRANGNLFAGNGISTDIVGACIRAYINALNKIVYEEK